MESEEIESHKASQYIKQVKDNSEIFTNIKDYIPFTREDRDFLRGKWVTNDKGDEYQIIGFKNKIWRDWIIVGQNISLSPDTLLKYYTFLNGKPCGKLKNQ